MGGDGDKDVLLKWFGGEGLPFELAISCKFQNIRNRIGVKQILQFLAISPLEAKLFVVCGGGVAIWANFTSDGEVGIGLDEIAIDRTRSTRLHNKKIYWMWWNRLKTFLPDRHS